VSLCNRKLGLFLALAQFTGYTILSYFFRRLDMSGGGGGGSGGGGGAGASIGGGGGSGTSFFSRKFRRLNNWGKLRGGGTSSSSSSDPSTLSKKSIPIELYIGLSVLRAIDLGMTNLAMQYVNYPAKTIMKSTRVVWTMLFGVIVSKKRYGMADFGIVGLMVAGLGMFMHADAHTSAVFQPIGIIMLIISLLGDGAISNLSEALMNQYEVGQDEFIFRLYSIATFFICIAAAAKGDLRDGLAYLTRPGTMKEIEDDLVPTWSVLAKIMTLVLFSTTGFLGSSCSAAITKSFGALTMSITSTARKATTIFLSFALFPSNKCTLEHIGGILLFIASLVAKSVRESRRGRHHHHHHQHHNQQFHHHSPMKNQHSHTMGNGGMLPPVIMEIVNMSGGRNASRKNKTSPMGSSPLQLRHKVSGEDAV
jgi:adenosine 3'-phospho 5'-phosphosulfate transporter B3